MEFPFVGSKSGHSSDLCWLAGRYGITYLKQRDLCNGLVYRTWLIHSRTILHPHPHKEQELHPPAEQVRDSSPGVLAWLLLWLLYWLLPEKTSILYQQLKPETPIGEYGDNIDLYNQWTLGREDIRGRYQIMRRKMRDNWGKTNKGREVKWSSEEGTWWQSDLPFPKMRRVPSWLTSRDITALTYVDGLPLPLLEKKLPLGLMATTCARRLQAGLGSLKLIRLTERSTAEGWVWSRS